MKTLNIPLIHPIAFLLVITPWFYNCHKEPSEETKPCTPGPKTGKERSVKVFEIKYDETISFSANGHDFTIKLVAVKDSVDVDCRLVYVSDPRILERVRVYADLQIRVNDKIQSYQVKSRSCGAFEYKNDGTDFQQITELINDIEKNGFSPTRWNFKDVFYGGTEIHCPYKIYMISAYPREYYNYKKKYTDNYKKKYTDADYKFIFAITTTS